MNDDLLSFCSRCGGKDPHCYICGEPMTQWHEMDTAPKDGRDILLLMAGGYVRVARYAPSRFWATDWFIALNNEKHSGGMYAFDPIGWLPVPSIGGPDDTDKETAA